MHQQIMVAQKISAGGGSGYGATVLSFSPVVYLRLAETSGSSAANIGSNGIAGTYTSCTLNQTSLCGEAGDKSALFNGSTSNVGVPTGTYSFTSPFTLQCLIRPNSITGIHGIYSFGTGMPYIRINGNQIEFLDSQVALLGTFSGTISTSTTYLVTVAVAANGAANYYLNGTSAGSNAAHTFTNSSASTIYIGSEFQSTDYFAGLIDEPAFFASQLSAGNVAAIATAAGL